MRWTKAMCPNLAQQLIPIDGKSVRRSHNGQSRMAHLVSAWHTDRGMVLAQVKTAAKSNDITAIPELLDALDVQGATITIDAMGCQRGGGKDCHQASRLASRGQRQPAPARTGR